MSETIPQLSDVEPSATQSVAAAEVGCRGWTGHVIVCGLQAVGVRTIEQLIAAGARVVVIDDEGSRERHLRALNHLEVPVIPRGSRTDDALLDAGIAGAESVICIEASDLRTLETVLMVHGLRPDVRVVARAVLEDLDALVIEAECGAAALLALRTRRVDLVLADLTMPHMNGIELAREVAALVPGLPVVLMTGYGPDALAEPGPHIRATLQKPFRADALAQCLAGALGLGQASVLF